MDVVLSWIGSIIGTASVPAIAAAVAWRYRAKLLAALEKTLAERLDRIVMNTEIGKRIVAIDEKLSHRKPLR